VKYISLVYVLERYSFFGHEMSLDGKKNIKKLGKMENSCNCGGKI
jgi:hypothetical protein